MNHFPHNKELTRKDLLRRNLARYQVRAVPCTTPSSLRACLTRVLRCPRLPRRLQCVGGKFAAAFDLCPPTFVLPKEYLAFTEAFAKASDS